MKDRGQFFEREKFTPMESYGLKVQQRHARGRIVSICIWVPGKCKLSSAETDF